MLPSGERCSSVAFHNMLDGQPVSLQYWPDSSVANACQSLEGSHPNVAGTVGSALLLI